MSWYVSADDAAVRIGATDLSELAFAGSTSTWSLSYWAKIPDLAQTHDFLGGFSYGKNGQSVYLASYVASTNYGTYPGAWRHYVKGTSTVPNIKIGSYMPPDEWVNVCIQRESDGIVRFYVDGDREYQTAADPGAISNGLYWWVGNDLDIDRGAVGYLARVMKCDRALTTDEIGRLAQGADPLEIESAPLVYFSADGDSGSFPDTADIDNTATGGVVATSAGTTAVTWVDDDPPLESIEPPTPPDISYPTPVTLEINKYQEILVTNAGGAATSWQSTPQLPSGLGFDATGNIVGTPDDPPLDTEYTITAANDDGNSIFVITIYVEEGGSGAGGRFYRLGYRKGTASEWPSFAISYAAQSLVVDAAMTTASPTVSGGTAASFEEIDTLPTGLSLNTSTGDITGTPTGTQSATLYEIGATSVGSEVTSTFISIAVVGAASPTISYAASPVTTYTDYQMTPVYPTNTGGAVVTYSDESGTTLASYDLVIDATTGKVSGIPNANMTNQDFTIRGTNASGFSDTTLRITSEAYSLPVGSLRPTDVLGDIAAFITADGQAPNNLATSLQTTRVEGTDYTDRTNDVAIGQSDIANGYICTASDTRYYLTEDVTCADFGFNVKANNVTIDGAGYSLTYQNTGMFDHVTGTVETVSKVEVSGKDKLVVTPTSGFGLVDGEYTNSDSVYTQWILVFTSGVCANRSFRITSNDDTDIILMGTSGGDARWPSLGGDDYDEAPSPGDTFAIGNCRKTYGVGVGSYNKEGLEIANLDIIQGTGPGGGRPDWGENNGAASGCNPIMADLNAPLDYVGGCYIEYWSDDTTGLAAGRSSTTVEYNTFHDKGVRILERQWGMSVANPGTSSTVSYNRVVNARHRGLTPGTGSTISYNEMFSENVDTNGYMLGGYALKDATIEYNNLYALGIHPQAIALHNKAQNNTVSNNWVEAMTTTNKNGYDKEEYPFNYATCISNRWAGGARTAANNIHDNALIAYASDIVDVDTSEVLVARRGRVIMLWSSDSNQHYEENWYDNYLCAHAQDGFTECRVLGGAGNQTPSVHTFYDNHILANQNMIFWGGDYSLNPGKGYPLFMDNAFEDIGDGSRFEFLVFNQETTTSGQVCEIDFVSNTYTDCDWDDVRLIQRTGSKEQLDDLMVYRAEDASWYTTNDYSRDIRQGWKVTVTVTSGGTPVEGATVVATPANIDGGITRTGTTDASGEVVMPIVVTAKRPDDGSEVSLTNVTVVATFGGESNSASIAPTADDTLSIDLVPATPASPPMSSMTSGGFGAVDPLTLIAASDIKTGA